MSLPEGIRDRLSLPVIAAPMFLVSGPELVVAACNEGVIGSFPTVNARTPEALDAWLDEIEAGLDDDAAPYSANLIVHRTNARLAADVEVVVRHRTPIIIASVGSPEPVIAPVHDYGGLVFADIASMRHAEKAIGLGIDGLILLCGGAGGQAGWANPFAFVRAVRAIYDGPIIVAGGISDGVTVRAVETLGADLAYLGTSFIATRESMAKEDYRQMLVDCRLDDILLTPFFTGLPTNMLRPSIAAAGLDPDRLGDRGDIEIGDDINPKKKRYRDIWAAGHSVSGVHRIQSVAELVAELKAGYEAAGT
jgi:nitronate monooxygenase